MPPHTPRIALLIALTASLLWNPPALAQTKAKITYRQTQYKRQGRNAVSQIVDGKAEGVARAVEKYLKEFPRDQESLFCLTVAYAQLNQIDKAMTTLQKALDAGLPFARFLAGPRDLLAPLYRSASFQSYAAKQKDLLLHGPLLGCVTDTGAKFWVRTAREVPVQVVVREVVLGVMVEPIKSAAVVTDKNMDFTAILTIDHLKPNTIYQYELWVNGEKIPQEKKAWSLRTYPKSLAKAKFQVGFGGGAGYTPQYEKIWNTIYDHHLLAFLFLGDNVYIDDPQKPAVQNYCYYRRQSRPEFRRFIASTAIYAIWDDHDFTTNDGRGGPAVDAPPWKRPVWNLFRNQWNNPYYGGGKDHPGCWFDFAIADVDFFMHDGRYYRENPKNKGASMLGPVQKKWLFEKLKQSKGTFKVLASPVPWASGTKPGSLDTWDGHPEEREEIFSFLEKHKIDGVVLLSADRHRSDLWKIERPQGYDLYEFESSRLTNIHNHKPMKKALFSYNEKNSFGLLTFDTTLSDPTLTYRIYNIDNELIHTFTLKKSQLVK